MNIVSCKKTKNGASLFRFAGKKIMKFDSLWGGALAENVFLLTNRPENKKSIKVHRQWRDMESKHGVCAAAT